MNLRKIIKFTAIAAAIFFVILFVTLRMAQPVLKDRLEAHLNRLDPNYRVRLGDIHVHLLRKSVDLIQINVTSGKNINIRMRIDTLQIQRIRIIKALFSKEYRLGVVSVNGLQISASLKDSTGNSKSLIIPFPLQIDRFICRISKLGISDIPDVGHISARSGYVRFDDVFIAKDEPLNMESFQKHQLSFGKISLQTADSNYMVHVDTIRYSTYKQSLFIGRIRLKPAFEHYAFAARMPWQTDRFDSDLKQIHLDGFSVIDLIANRMLVVKKIEIADARFEAFRDKRKPFNHVTKPSFTEMMYRYPGKLQIDSVVVVKSHIIYLEHNPDAQKAGRIEFEKAELKLNNITNDTLNTGTFHLKGRALLMGKSWFTVELIAKHFDPLGTFQVKGSIQKMNVSAINPMLEESSFVTVKSGNLEHIDFDFFGNQHLAVGNLKMIYKELNLAFLDPSSEKNPGVITLIKTWLLNRMIIDSNPQKDHLPRSGIIRYERDPERFLFNYCAKAIFSGIKTTILKK